MRHRVAGRKLSRTSAHRRALSRNLMLGLLVEFDRKGFIVTTREKAKFVQPHVEKLISLARTKSLANIRRAISLLQSKELVKKLFDEIGPYYAKRPGGYTRVVRLARRRLGDNASQAYFGFVRDEKESAGAPVVS
ncbi:MAG: 50S ribosomal protein L17 [Planctomycetota bacterium]